MNPGLVPFWADGSHHEIVQPFYPDPRSCPDEGRSRALAAPAQLEAGLSSTIPCQPF